MKYSEMTITQLQAAMPDHLQIRVYEVFRGGYIGKIFDNGKPYLTGDKQPDPDSAARDVVHLWMH